MHTNEKVTEVMQVTDRGDVHQRANGNDENFQTLYVF